MIEVSVKVSSHRTIATLCHQSESKAIGCFCLSMTVLSTVNLQRTTGGRPPQLLDLKIGRFRIPQQPYKVCLSDMSGQMIIIMVSIDILPHPIFPLTCPSTSQKCFIWRSKEQLWQLVENRGWKCQWCQLPVGGWYQEQRVGGWSCYMLVLLLLQKPLAWLVPGKRGFSVWNGKSSWPYCAGNLDAELTTVDWHGISTDYWFLLFFGSY